MATSTFYCNNSATWRDLYPKWRDDNSQCIRQGGGETYQLMRGVALWDMSSIRSTLSGQTVDTIEIYFHRNAVSLGSSVAKKLRIYGVSAASIVLGGGSAPTWGTNYGDYDIGAFDTGTWITLPLSAASAIINSQVVGFGTNYESYNTTTYYTEQYGVLGTDTQKPKLRITYHPTNTAPSWPAGASISVTPSGLVASTVNSLAVSWSNANDAEGGLTYYVTRSISGGAYTSVYTGASTSFNDNIGAGETSTYTYKVYASDGTYNTSTLTSNTVTKNTKPTWNGSTVSVDGHTSATTIPENDTSLNIAWSSINVNNSGQTAYYDLFRISPSTVQLATKTTATSLTDNIGSGNQGVAYQYRVFAHDGMEYPTTTNISSPVITKNTLTGATLASATSVAFATASIAWTWNGASNTNGNGTFSYRISSSDITIYNQANNITTPFTMPIWRTGDAVPAATTPYIKFDDLKTKFAGSSYNGSLVFKLTTTNAYASTKTSNKTITVDIRTNPIGLGTPTTSNYYTVNAVNYYIPNRKTVNINWTAATDPLTGKGITYDVQVSLAGGGYTTIRTGLTTNSTTYSTGVSSATACQFKVIAKASYGKSVTSAASTSITLHYWNPPSVQITNINRNSTGFTFVGTVTQGTTSAPALNTDYPTNTRYYKLGVAANVYSTTTYTASEITLAETSTSAFELGYRNWGYYGIISTTAYVTDTVTITTYNPMFSIRENGVSVNSTAPDTSDGFIFRIKGKTILEPDINWETWLSYDRWPSSSDSKWKTKILEPHDNGVNVGFIYDNASDLYDYGGNIWLYGYGKDSFRAAYASDDGSTLYNSLIWHEGNDGADSGLDADLLDGYNTSLTATANTVAVRNASGDLFVRELSAARSLLITTNGYGIWQKDTGGTMRSLLSLTTGNDIMYGNTALKTTYYTNGQLKHYNGSVTTDVIDSRTATQTIGGQLNVKALYATNNVSALSFTDRTPFYEGDALTEIAKISSDGKGGINHATLPTFARKTISTTINKSAEVDGKIVDIDNKEEKIIETVVEEGRDIGAMVSVLTVAIQQLITINSDMQKQIDELKSTLK